jgi:hypothetical protein
MSGQEYTLILEPEINISIKYAKKRIYSATIKITNNMHYID